MTIKGGWYVSKCTSEAMPKARLNAETFYLPVGIEKGDDELYHYSEYRFNLPAPEGLPKEVYGLMCEALSANTEEFSELEQRTTAVEDAIMELAGIIESGEDNG